MNDAGPDIEIAPARPLPVRQQTRPGAPLAVVGRVGMEDQRHIFLHARAVEAILGAVPGREHVEVGGLLVGWQCQDNIGLYLQIAGALPARDAVGTALSVTFGHDTWESLLAEKALHHADQDVVGWYHTHPGLGVFLSQHDLFIQRHFFADPVQVALVVDPADFTWGLFYWQGGDLVAARGCHVYGEPDETYQHLAELLQRYEITGQS